MEKIKYSPISKKVYDDIINKSVDTACNIQRLTVEFEGMKDITNITKDEVEILKKAFDILNNNADKFEDYIDTVEEFYDPSNLQDIER